MNRRTLLTGSGAVGLAGAGAAWLGVRGTGSMHDYEAAVAATRSVLPVRADLADLVRYATLAPNGHNTQPWRFRLAQGRIDVLPDPARRTPVVDPDDHHLFVSLGAAAENLSLAGAANWCSIRRTAGPSPSYMGLGRAGCPTCSRPSACARPRAPSMTLGL